MKADEVIKTAGIHKMNLYCSKAYWLHIKYKSFGFLSMENEDFILTAESGLNRDSFEPFSL